ncbi:uncharacterized protein LOC111272547 isoform X2 [Varroa jacobsoni]|uniref:Uncharacterized protein n=1 Tax=Varroa destructor TaxID=109461 RepID=A0A7M7KA76_VARDE|nr:uncharacterized protein LOC111251500 isoform X2 [Varroa destructor]XP_022709798.1 uncharacterized protein LOC111272547 isoform X2 [Varroa jacobsoni]
MPALTLKGNKGLVRFTMCIMCTKFTSRSSSSLCVTLWMLSTLCVLLVYSELSAGIEDDRLKMRIRREADFSGLLLTSINNTHSELFRNPIRTVTTVPGRKKPVIYSTTTSNEEYSKEPSSKCPLDKTSIEPCTCRSLARGIAVECEGLVDSNGLFSAFKDLRSYIMHDTVLIDIHFEIENRVFDSMKFIILTFRKGKVTIRGNKDEYSLAKLVKKKVDLQQVNFMQCQVDLGNTTLRHQPLKNLELLETSLENYNPIWFDELKVERVRISSANLQQYNLTKGMKYVQQFIYSNSALSVVTRGTFPTDVTELRHIDLSSNNLANLPSGLFDHMTALVEVVLKGNRFTTLEANLMNHKAWLNMTLLNLEGNTGLRCEGVQWLRSVATDKLKVKGDCLDKDDIVQKIK